jgi:hypothetical protein
LSKTEAAADESVLSVFYIKKLKIILVWNKIFKNTPKKDDKKDILCISITNLWRYGNVVSKINV